MPIGLRSRKSGPPGLMTGKVYRSFMLVAPMAEITAEYRLVHAVSIPRRHVY